MNTNLSKVLVPIDGSAFSLQILAHIIHLLPPAKTELVILRVEPMPTLVELGGQGDPELTIYADQQAASLEANFHTEMYPQLQALEQAGFAVSLTMRFGDPAEEIERYSIEEGVDMVAMTTHGRTGLDRMLFGSVAQYLLRHLQVPLLLYRSSIAAKLEMEIPSSEPLERVAA
jgi:nucleotide-binding universal stress UspA family protein